MTRPNVTVTLVALAACLLVTSVALLAGAAVGVRATRVRPRVTEEVLETRGIVTVPVQRVVQDGRVDVTVRRRVLGVIPWRTYHLEDVVDVASGSGRTDVRGSRGRGSRSYGTESLTLRTRAGVEWDSGAGSGVFGSSPSVVAARLRAFVDGSAEGTLALWWAPRLENLVGIPFALVTALILLALVRTALARAGAA